MFITHTEQSNYLSIMIEACAEGDDKTGYTAEQIRNAKIDVLDITEKKISYSDLKMLSKVIHIEAGSSWLSDEWKLMVGEVLLNRVESPHYPDTLEECIKQPRQYYGNNSEYFNNLIPDKRNVKIAARLLSGERIINDTSVVYQAEFTQGSGIYKILKDKKGLIGTTYICYK
jgi:spore germination cell wall hydrolase CwlJ-like protein